ncbi:MAG: MgtC/SapB family protein, partial [Nanoarchaeota archaeon]
GQRIRNLTTAASIWFAASIGMAIGVGWYLVAGIATIYSVLVPLIPNFDPNFSGNHREKRRNN